MGTFMRVHSCSSVVRDSEKWIAPTYFKLLGEDSTKNLFWKISGEELLRARWKFYSRTSVFIRGSGFPELNWPGLIEARELNHGLTRINTDLRSWIAETSVKLRVWCFFIQPKVWKHHVRIGRRGGLFSAGHILGNISELPKGVKHKVGWR